MSDFDQDEEFTTELPLIWQFVHPEYVRPAGSGENSAAGSEDSAAEEEEEEDEVIRKKNAPKISKLLRYLNDIEDDEELERILQERDPVTQQTLLQWATRQQHFLLAEYLVKRAKRAAFGFNIESTEMVIYTKWEEMRPELPTPAEIQARQQRRDQKRAARLAEKQQRRLEAYALRHGGDANNMYDEDGQPRAGDDDNNDDEEEENEEDEEEEDEENEPLPEELVFEALSEYHDEWGDGGAGVVKRVGELGVYDGGRRKCDGAKHGVGHALFPNGDAYTGEYVGNMRHGLGLYWWATQGIIYTGQWHNGIRHGIGRITYPDGSHYRGLWVRDEKHGTGRYLYADGSSYDGAWAHNMKHGYGVYRFTDGSSFHGSFVENAFVSGEWRLASGTTRYIGNFEKDVPVGAGVFLHRLGPTQHGAFQQEGYYHKGEWHPGILHGTTRVPPRLEVFAPHQQKQQSEVLQQQSSQKRKKEKEKSHKNKDTTVEAPRRVPVTFAQECNGGTMADLVKAVNFSPVQRWMKSLISVYDNPTLGVVLQSMEVCSIKYDPEDESLVTEVRLRPVLHDAAGKRLRLSVTGDETIILKERTTRLLLMVEQPGKEEKERTPMVILERSVQLTSPGERHMQLRLPTIQITMGGEITGAFARAIQAPLRITLNLHTTKKLLRPLRSNPMIGDAEEDVMMYVQQWHSEAFATLKEKLEVASAIPPKTTKTTSSSQDPKQVQQQQQQQQSEEEGGDNSANPLTEGCSYVAVPLHEVMHLSTDAITVIATTALLRRKQLSQMPIATVGQQRPPTPLPPKPEPRPELQPLYDARAAMKLAEEAADEEDGEGNGEE
ncbi:MORN motif [Trypanosoma melophagium]|uniref:MORN motif n=1 Tax=Trypanosoma melophagium TaxID=715481 RepID=UPI003519F081|nr:MORN motif [Trypanosoma melophagium]